ncbi:MAG TPA: hypothetical protein VM490_15410, partial [Armatimonadaceae bacterium]|nr:hypothetical protein [Armatimonadaceae bacterium]
WLHRFYSDTFWTNPGGDFVAQASSDISVGDFGTYVWTSTPTLVADVQGWVNDPAANHGWLLQGNEAQGGTAKGFASGEYNLNPDYRPTLFVNYVVVPEAGSLPLLAVGGAVGLFPIAARRRRRSARRRSRTD